MAIINNKEELIGIECQYNGQGEIWIFTKFINYEKVEYQWNKGTNIATWEIEGAIRNINNGTWTIYNYPYKEIDIWI